MQLTLTALISLLALSPLTLAEDLPTSTNLDSSSSGSSSAKPSSSSGSASNSKSSSSGGPAATPAYTITGMNSAQSSAFASYTSARAHDSSMLASISAATASATQTSALSFFDPYAPSVISVLQKAVTATGSAEYPSIPSNLPSQYSSYWSSVYKAEVSLLTKQATNSSNAAVGMPTAAVIAAGAGVLGAVGLAGMV